MNNARAAVYKTLAAPDSQVRLFSTQFVKIAYEFIYNTRAGSERRSSSQNTVQSCVLR